MAKKLKQCSGCIFWKGKSPDRNLCSKLVVGVDIFISGRYLLTSSSFGCVNHKEKEVKDDESVFNGDATDGSSN